MINRNMMVVAGVEIHESDGLYSLTDLHKASGGNDKNRPSRWLRRQRTKSLISELNNDLSEVIKSDKKAGTFACPEAVIAYAMSVSPVFEVEVIREYLKSAQKKLRQAQLQGKAEWQQNRELGIYQRHDLTDTIQLYVDYSKAHGSRNAGHYFTHITNAVHKAIGVDDRDSIPEHKLHLLATSELIIERSLQHGMAECLPYKTIFQLVKAQMADFREMTQEVQADES